MTASRILVVDDDPVILDLLALSFELEGFLVLKALDGPHALDIARDRLPDVVLTDIMMPDMSGLELMRNLRADPVTASIPVVLLSAKALAADVKAGMDAGADDYVTKPFEPNHLLEAIHRVLPG